MRSFKENIRIISITVLVLLISSILLNTFYIRPLMGKLDNLKYHISEYEVVLGQSELPISVMNNVVAQLNTDRELEPDRKNNILNAYSRNYQQMITNDEKMRDVINDIYSYYSSLKGVPYSRVFVDLKSVGGEVLFAQTAAKQLEDMLSDLNQYEIVGNKNGIVEIKDLMGKIKENILLLQENVTNLKNDAVDIHITITNSTYIILLMVIAVLCVFLSMVGNDINYMIEGFKLLSRFDPDSKKLPKLKPFFSEERYINDLVEDIFVEQSFLNDIKDISSQTYILDEILEQLFNRVQGVFRTDRIGIAFINYDTNMMIAEYGISNYGEILLGPGFDIPLDETSMTQRAEKKESSIIYDMDKELLKRSGSKSLVLLVKEGIKSNMMIPLINDDVVFGYLFFSSREVGTYNEDTLQIGKNISHELSSILNHTYLTKKMFSTMTSAFASLVDKKDNETGDHLDRMTAYSTLIAIELLSHENPRYKINQSFINDIKNNACVHDIGKVGIPDHILKKPGRHTPEEWEIMKTHAEIGGEVLSQMREGLKNFNKNFYQTAIDIARHHHEKWDGSGYPHGLMGHDIPLAARIVAIGDVFDALTSKRVYKDAMTFDTAVKIIQEGSGKHFDPELVKVFNKLIPKFQEIYNKSSDSMRLIS